MRNAVVTSLISASTKNGFIHQSGRKYKKEDVVFNTLKYQYLNTKRAASRRSKAFLLHKSFAQIFEELRRTNLWFYLTPKVESRLKPSNYVAKPSYLHAYRTEVPMYTPFAFLRDKTLVFCTGWMYPCLPLTIFFCFLFAGNVGCLKTQLYKNIQEPKCMAHSFFFYRGWFITRSS